MSAAYDKELRELAWAASRELGCAYVREGVYLCQIGPCFESIAESRMMRQWGADTAGMSTVFEVSVARHVGMRCLGLSLVTNMCIVDYDTPQVAASHAETLESGRQRADDLKQLVHRIVGKLPVQAASGAEPSAGAEPSDGVVLSDGAVPSDAAAPSDGAVPSAGVELSAGSEFSDGPEPIAAA